MFEEQPIGWRLSVQLYRPATAHIKPFRDVVEMTFPTREAAQAEQAKLADNELSTITPVYVTAAKRDRKYGQSQTALADLPLMKKRLTE